MMQWRLRALALMLVLTGCGNEVQNSDKDNEQLFPDGGWPTDGSSPVDTLQPDGGVDIGTDGSSSDLLPDTLPPTDLLPDGKPDTSWHIKIVAPGDGNKVSGTVTVRIECVEKEELRVDALDLTLNDAYLFHDTKLPTEFVLDTSAYTNGTLTLLAVAKVGDESTSHGISLIAENPSFAFRTVSADRTEVFDGATVHMDVEASKPGLIVKADFGYLDSGFAAGFGTFEDKGNGWYSLEYKVASNNAMPDGLYSVPVTASDGGENITSQHVSLRLINSPQIPLRVEGAIYVPGAMPPATATWTQPISLVYGNDFIITGGSAKINVDFSGYTVPDEIVGILIGAEGMAGYFQKPLDSTLGEEEVRLLMRTYTSSESPPNKVTLQVAVKDIRGRISPTRTHKLSVQAVGSGDVQVSVSWDSKTDVDLHVIEPTDCELYYGHKKCDSGGWLDLDSNPACAIDNINNENVFWPAGSAPVGTYKVKVDYYDDCGTFGPGLAANYTVTIHYCGRTDLYDGYFPAGSSDSGGAGSGVEVATFNNQDCGKLLKGRVRFVDHTIDRFGTGAWQWKPVRFASIEVVRDVDNVVLASTYTDRLGNYEVYFSNTGTAGIYLRVLAKTKYEDKLRKITVMNHPKFKKVYAVKSPTVDDSAMADPELSLDIGMTEPAGAFNILDVVSDGYDTIRLMTGTDLGELTVFWATGADTTDTLFCSQYFYDEGTCTELNALSVQGKDSDRDEYDDMVILKEFFKFALAFCSRDDNPGGYHDGTRDDPRRSWSEGVSTFFPCDVLGSQWFVNSRPGGVYIVQDLEQMNSPYAFKAEPGVIDGNLSEYLVSSVLWDLADSSDGESLDLVHGKRLPIYDSVFNYLPGPKFHDRGVEGVDLVDFLDGWFCRAWGENIPVMKLLTEKYFFGYEIGGPTNCFSGQ